MFAAYLRNKLSTPNAHNICIISSLGIVTSGVQHHYVYLVSLDKLKWHNKKIIIGKYT